MLIIAAVARHSSETGAASAAATEQVEGAAKKSGGLLVRVNTWVGRVENFIYGGKEADNDETRLTRRRSPYQKAVFLE